MSDEPGQHDDGAKAPDDRDLRRAAALRANLQRRKAALRAKTTPSSTQMADGEPPPGAVSNDGAA